MKTIKIYERVVTERTGYKKVPFKAVRQVTITQGNKIAENHYENINNPKLKVKFEKTFESRSKKAVYEYINRLGRTDVEKWIKCILEQSLEEEK